MPIQALPASSVRALGSGQVLTDALALVKELLDNALDASSTQISIEVSSNALDVIQVTDNGHGIPAEDRDAMAVRYCTSKIRDFADLLDCRSLGFRGEALASAAELAGTLLITTRVDGEKTATACTCDRAGQVVGRKPVGAPLGTTVRVSDFFKHLPVRRENAIKGAAKTITRLRALVLKYYLSHPQCRFSLRVLSPPLKGTKARGEDVVYAPSKSVPEAVQKGVGKDVAAACEWIDTSSAAYAEALAEADEEADEDPVVLEAFLPKPTTDPAVISKKPHCTHFISVDSRSVSCARGTLKQIHALYKAYLKSASPAPGPSDPFVYLNICCPPGTYDPNIEPAKDDVLFHDADAVVRVVERMLTRFYGELKTEEKPGRGKVPERARQNGFELLLARKPKKTPAIVATSPAKERWPKRLPPVRPAEIMDYGDVDEDEEEMAAMAVDMAIDEEMETCGFVAVNSPAASAQRRNKTRPRVDDGDPPMAPGDEPVPTTNDDDETLPEPVQPPAPPEPGAAAPPTDTDAPDTAPLVTPRRKSTNWGFNMAGGLPDSDSDSPMAGGLEIHDSDNEETVRRDITLSNPWTAAKINAPIVSSPVSSSPPAPIHPRNPTRGRPFNLRGSSPPDIFPTPAPSSPPAGVARETRVSVSRRARQSREPKSGSAGLMNSWISRTPRSEPGESPQRTSPGFVSAAKAHQQQLDDDDDDQYYEERSRRLTRAQEAAKRAAGPSKRRRLDPDLDPEDQNSGFTPANSRGTRSSPHRNRFLAATAALGAPSLPLPLPPLQARRRRRTTTVLPLDAVPEALLQTHHISRTADVGVLRDTVARLRGCDVYVGAAAAAAGSRVGGVFFSECEAWDDLAVLGGLVEGWMIRVAEGEGEGDGLVEGVRWEMVEREEGMRVLWAVGAEEEGVVGG